MNNDTKLLQELKSLLRLKIFQEELIIADFKNPLLGIAHAIETNQSYGYLGTPDSWNENFRRIAYLAYQDMQMIGMVKNQTKSEEGKTL